MPPRSLRAPARPPAAASGLPAPAAPGTPRLRPRPASSGGGRRALRQPRTPAALPALLAAAVPAPGRGGDLSSPGSSETAAAGPAPPAPRRASTPPAGAAAPWRPGLGRRSAVAPPSPPAPRSAAERAAMGFLPAAVPLPRQPAPGRGGGAGRGARAQLRAPALPSPGSQTRRPIGWRQAGARRKAGPGPPRKPNKARRGAGDESLAQRKRR